MPHVLLAINTVLPPTSQGKVVYIYFSHLGQIIFLNFHMFWMHVFLLVYCHHCPQKISHFHGQSLLCCLCWYRCSSCDAIILQFILCRCLFINLHIHTCCIIISYVALYWISWHRVWL